MEKIQFDEGYGLTGNLATFVILSEADKKQEKEYRDKLKKENPEAYAEYEKWEKEYRKLEKHIKWVNSNTSSEQ